MVLGKYRRAIEEHATVLWEETSDYPIGRLTGEVCVTPVFDETDRWTHIVGSVYDITERKRAKAALRQSEARLMNAQRLAQLGSWERDEETGKTEFSDEMLRILGMPEHPPSNLTEFLDKPRLCPRRSGTCLGRRPPSPFERGTGCRGVPNRPGRQRGPVCALRFASDPKRGWGGDSRRAHDFNNLLGGVLAQAELALAELDVGSSCKEEVKAIREVAIRGSEIVRQLMIYAGKEREVIGRVDLSNIVEQMFALLKVSVSKHAVIVADLAQDLPVIAAITHHFGRLSARTRPEAIVVVTSYCSEENQTLRNVSST